MADVIVNLNAVKSGFFPLNTNVIASDTQIVYTTVELDLILKVDFIPCPGTIQVASSSIPGVFYVRGVPLQTTEYRYEVSGDHVTIYESNSSGRRRIADAPFTEYANFDCIQYPTVDDLLADLNRILFRS